jgi:hypothetical protein
LTIYFVEDDGELVDGAGGLPAKLCWGPPELFAEAEVCDCGVRLFAFDDSDKKAVSSRVMAHKPLTTRESNSPSAMGTPSSSLNSFSSVIGALAGCSLSAAQMVSACIAMKSLLTTCPDKHEASVKNLFSLKSSFVYLRWKPKLAPSSAL